MLIGSAGVPLELGLTRDYDSIFSQLEAAGVKVYFPTTQYQEIPTTQSLGFETDFLPPPYGTADPAVYAAMRAHGIKLAINADMLYDLREAFPSASNDPLLALISAAGRDLIYGIYGPDEPAFRGIDPAQSKALYEHVKAIDATLPVIQVHRSLDEEDPANQTQSGREAYLAEVLKHAQWADTVGFDVYAVGISVGAMTPLSNGETVPPAQAIKQYMTWLAEALPGKAYTMVLQAFSPLDLFSAEKLAEFDPAVLAATRAPTAQEMQDMLAAAEGAEAVFWWGQSHLRETSSQTWQNVLAESKAWLQTQGGSMSGVVTGTNGAETLSGGAAADHIVGLGGNDMLVGEGGNDVLSGGEDDDYLLGGAGDDTLEGEGGDDQFFDHEGSNSQSGGSGQDRFHYVSFGDGLDTFTGGADADTYHLEWQQGAVADTITDFAAGAAGDTIDAGSLLDQLVGFESGSNPFAAGFLRLRQDGADTKLQVNPAGLGDAWQTVLVLQGTSAAALTAGNFVQGWAPANANRAPVVSVALPDKSVVEDKAVSFALPANTFTDADGDTLALSAKLEDGAALPSWLAFNAATRTFAGNPPANFDGQLAIKVTASDGKLSASDTFILDLTPVNDAPVLSRALVDRSVAEDKAVSFVLPADSFADVDNASLTYAATLAGGGALPTWLKFNPASRAFSGSPPTDFTGSVAVKVTASDGKLSASDIFTLNVTPVNDAPRITSGGGADAVVLLASENRTAVTRVTASDVDVGTKLTYSVKGGADRDAFTIDANGNLGFKAAPDFENPVDKAGITAAKDGVYEVVVQVSDGTLTDSQTIVVGVSNVEGVTRIGTGAADRLVGAGEEDIIFGGRGNDTIWGKAGTDFFVFDAKPDSKTNFDRIIDFNHRDDTICLNGDADAFASSAIGMLAASAFKLIANATSTTGIDKDDRILYDKAHGDLYFDRDGSGLKYERVKFAELTDGILIDNSDFLLL